MEVLDHELIVINERIAMIKELIQMNTNAQIHFHYWLNKQLCEERNIDIYTLIMHR
jgi:hypothetical protein